MEGMNFSCDWIGEPDKEIELTYKNICYILQSDRILLESSFAGRRNGGKYEETGTAL